MRWCPKPIAEQTIPELADCGLQTLTSVIARLLQSYVQVISDPPHAALFDWGIVIGSFCGVAALIAKVMAGNAN
ncbi:MAG: hypothetical protein K2Y29_07210 [Beijerinckiaceae bacterium]|nr:hypothetical protein [Beijerinckiaceae bacterium]